MRIALVGAELEENLGLRYIASSLEADEHTVDIIPFNSAQDTNKVVRQVDVSKPRIVGLSMVFTGRAREFCRLAQALRDNGYRGHIIAGGHFASFNCQALLKDFPVFDSVALGEGEYTMRRLAAKLDDVSEVPGICCRRADGSIAANPATYDINNLDALPFPKRTTFHSYFDKPIGSILSSRGCWRNCAFCSINAWYKFSGGKKFRVRSIDNLLEEMKELYFNHGVRIFNFQDDNFFLPKPDEALRRFESLRDGLKREGMEGIAIAVKARPDSINRDAIRVLDEIGLFRVFLGVENASQSELDHLNRKSVLDEILNALVVLNDFDVHVAYNILLFEPETTMKDIHVNLRFMERHIDNPFNFCRAEVYAGTGLEAKLRPQGRILGDYFGFDYRLTDPSSEAFHSISNYAFFDRNFSDYGLHYFNMQVDFYYQLLRRFHPELVTESLRSEVRNFIKQTNLDTYMILCRIYDFVAEQGPENQALIRSFAREMREQVDHNSRRLRAQGERIQSLVGEAYEGAAIGVQSGKPSPDPWLPFLGCKPIPYRGVQSLKDMELIAMQTPSAGSAELVGAVQTPIPYNVFKKRLAQ